jgi:hemerythrin-like domain-containing protein
MTSIKMFLSSDHRHCDETLTQIENAVSKNDWNDAAKSLNQFLTEMNRHLGFEENVLFPAFEKATGMTFGPTMVMRSEHILMREIFREMEEACQDKNEDRLLGLCETLMILIQQHNNKEEQMLYVMCDMHLAENAEVLLAQFDV